MTFVDFTHLAAEKICNQFNLPKCRVEDIKDIIYDCVYDAKRQNEHRKKKKRFDEEKLRVASRLLRAEGKLFGDWKIEFTENARKRIQMGEGFSIEEHNALEYLLDRVDALLDDPDWDGKLQN